MLHATIKQVYFIKKKKKMLLLSKFMKSRLRVGNDEID